MIEILYDDGQYRIEMTRLAQRRSHHVYRHLHDALASTYDASARTDSLECLLPNDLAWERIFRRLRRHLGTNQQIPRWEHGDLRWHGKTMDLIYKNVPRFQFLANDKMQDISA